ncbi:hypothetical protein [Saccharopolyspora erythraea]|uniref:hypothetical protein n=1 Tax=Saccharopolyspora erythraea TaxID=1836 RepID=UPI0001D30F66|nr:hypothetical protein [Saccharopolyspora erythraea]EQD81480.1 hypothetical protein N599_35935 [Saccharopolyspora erythraea D]
MGLRKLIRRARSRADYTWFLAAREWPVLVSALGVLLGAITILPSAVGIVLSLLALVLGIVTFVRDLRQLRGRWSAYEFSSIASPFPHQRIPAPAAYPASQYLHFANRGTALVSDEIDRALRERSFTAVVDEQPYALPPLLRATAPHVLPIRARGRLLFNGAVVGMRTDPLPGAGGAPTPIRLHRARFFDVQCSNELCSMRITRRDTGEEFDPRTRLLTDASGRLRTLAAGELADVVGISTLALTTDGHVLLVLQSDRNAASPMLLAPSGSGSLEPRDLKGPGGAVHGALRDSLRAGMERELREETGLPAEALAGTELTGFARWMERGAKPEFFGVTRLSVSSAEVRGTRAKGAELLYSEGVDAVGIDLAALGEELRAGTGVLAADSLPDKIRDVGSLPLLLALRAAALVEAGEAAVEERRP